MQGKGPNFMSTKSGQRGKILRKVGYRESQRYSNKASFFMQERIKTQASKAIEIVPADQPFIHIVYPPSSVITDPSRRWESFIWEQQLVQLRAIPRPQDPTNNTDVIQIIDIIQRMAQRTQETIIPHQSSSHPRNDTPRTRWIKTSTQVAALLKPQNPSSKP